MSEEANSPRMAIVLTQWAVDSYLDLKHSRAFSLLDYKETLRPDAELLEDFPANE